MDRRRFDLDEYIQENRQAARRVWLQSEGARVGSKRPVRRRPRDPEEVAILTHLAKARLDRALAGGEFTIVEGRRYRLRVLG